MFTLCSMNPLLTQKLLIPSLSTTGHMPSLDASEALDLPYLPSMNTIDQGFDADTFGCWPEFHNGCASALRIFMKKDPGN